jgi:formate dehydrogenase subunit gamma
VSWEDVVSGRTAFDLSLAQALIDRKRDTPGATLPILHDLQERFGYIDDRVVPLVADALNISRAETLGVISFYHDFHRSPFDGRVLKLCRAESCQSMGCEDLVSHLELRHGLKVDDEDDHSPLHIKTVYCLGNCALSPAALIDGEPIGRLDRDRIDAIVAAAQGKTQ